MAVKCNIIPSVLEEIDRLHWGTPANSSSLNILENYLENLKCYTVEYIPCISGDCADNTINMVCALAIAKISNIIEDTKITFFIADGDITNGVAPYSYKWEYETNDFDSAGAIDIDKSILVVKANKKISLLISNIKVTITDSNKCVVTKSCYITPQGMKCASDYIPCMTNTNLIVSNKIVRCVAPSSLLVFKKQ